MNKFICLQFLTAIIWLKNTDPYLESCAQPLPSKWAYTITIKKCTHSYRHLHNLKKKIRDHLKNGFVTFTGKNACQITWYMVTDYYYTKEMDIKLFKYVLDGGFFKDVSNCRAFYFLN